VPGGSEPADWLAVFELMRTRGSRAPEPPICRRAVTDRHCWPCRPRTGGSVPDHWGGAGSRMGAVVPGLLLVAGTSLPAAMFREGFAM